MTESRLHDELSLRYHEACAQDRRRPSDRVRAAVHAHAAMVISAQENNSANAVIQKAPAANQMRWRLSLLASIALLGLTSLLVLQFDRGTPEEQEQGLDRPSASLSPTPTATAPQPQSPAAKPAMESESAKEVSLKPRAIPTRKAKPNQSERPTPEPALVAATTSSQLADAANAGPSAIGSVEPGGTAAASATSALRAAKTALAPVAAATPRQGPKRSEQAAQVTEKASPNATDLTVALHASARAGEVPQIERLLKQGALINAPDAAGRTPLILAAMNGHAALVERLLTLGANPALTDRDGLTALQHARQLGYQQIADLLGG
jgi:ankyrin repeat protein